MKDYIIEPTDYTVTLRATHLKNRYPIAYASIKVVTEDNKRIGKLVGLIRLKEFKNLGICEELIKKRIEICKTLGCDLVYTAIYYKRTGIIKCYKSLGFKEIESITPEYVRLIREI